MVGAIVGLLIVIAIALILLKVAIAAGLVGLIALVLLILLLLGRIQEAMLPAGLEDIRDAGRPTAQDQ